MKLSIITSDGSVYKDGFSFSNLSLSGIPENVHALQWDTDKGWIEFLNESEFRRPANLIITELPQWAKDALSKWEEADVQMKSQPETTGAQTL